MLTVAELRCTTAETTLLEVDALELAAGERLGLVGASGSGKSLLLRALVGLRPRGIDVCGALRFAGASYDLGRPAALAGLRGRGLAYLSQSAAASLDPTRRVDAQLAEVLSLHLQREMSGRRDAAEDRRRRLAEVALDPAIAEAYPHQLSGGQAQRVALALALACGPRVLLADEPTANLDTLSGARVLAAIDDAIAGEGLAMILVSHDLAEVAARCPRLVVLDRGRVVDRGATVDVLLEGESGSRSSATRRLVAAARVREAAIADAIRGGG
ncbi:MAG: ATP-binding cassette domain-containing protein [Myxococcales bacterium]|nr:ATP-binding cassette domain-containing protein [Myxococcales bacterium]